jgi:hypothetical protein
MLEKLIIVGSIALVASIYPGIKIYQGASIPMYQAKVTKFERKIAEIKVLEQDPAIRYVKISKFESKIVRLREKIAERSKVQQMRAKWEYQDELIKLKRKQVFLDSTLVLMPK